MVTGEVLEEEDGGDKLQDAVSEELQPLIVTTAATNTDTVASTACVHACVRACMRACVRVLYLHLYICKFYTYIHIQYTNQLLHCCYSTIL